MAGLLQVQRFEFFSLGIQTTADFRDPRVQRFGTLDLQRKNVGPALIADAQHIGEPPGDGQHHGFATALQQRVGAYRRAHLDGGNGGGGIAMLIQQIGDTLEGRIGIAFRVFRQQFVSQQPAVRRQGHEVGKGSAAIDPELPRMRACTHGESRGR